MLRCPAFLGRTAIAGVGYSSLSRRSDRSVLALAVEATRSYQRSTRTTLCPSAGAERGSCVTQINSIVKPMHAVGRFFSTALETLWLIPQRPFAWREFLLQSWFVARVSIVPTVMLSIPFTVLAVFEINILLVELGAADFSGTGAAFGAVTQIGPLVTVLVVAGAGATAMCADLGARTIREELDAMRVLGINPIQALVDPPPTDTYHASQRRCVNNKVEVEFCPASVPQ
jgi:hypothetical protein